MDRTAAKYRQTAPPSTPRNFSTNAVRDISGALTGVLANLFALYVKTTNFHWHVSGLHIRDYHLLDEQRATPITSRGATC